MARNPRCEHDWADARGEIELTDDEWEAVDAGDAYVFKCVNCGTFVLEDVEGFLGRKIGDRPLRKWKA